MEEKPNLIQKIVLALFKSTGAYRYFLADDFKINLRDTPEDYIEFLLNHFEPKKWKQSRDSTWREGKSTEFEIFSYSNEKIVIRKYPTSDELLILFKPVTYIFPVEVAKVLNKQLRQCFMEKSFSEVGVSLAMS